MAGDARTILIVESNRNSAITLEFLFAQNGFHVVVANSSEEALERFDEAPVAVTIVNARLPYRSGYELCQIVRRMHVSTKVILLLESGSDANTGKAKAMGADAWFAKPYSTRELVRTVRNLLEEPA